MNRNNRTRSGGFEALNYVYSFNVASLAAGASAQDTINIDSDSNFHWVKGSFFAAIASATQTDSSRVLPLINLQLTDTGSGRQFFDNPIPITTFFGTGEIPFILPLEQIFSSNSTIKADFTSFDAAATYTDIELSLIGFKKYL